MDVIRNGEIQQAFTQTGRVYLCGNLQKENGIRHIKTEAYEIGISRYPVFSCDKPHYHTFNTEYNYVLEGEVKILLLNEKKEYVFHAGDLYVININEPYATKSQAGTKIIFSKVPGGNDKVLVTIDDVLLSWEKDWDSEYK